MGRATYIGEMEEQGERWATYHGGRRVRSTLPPRAKMLLREC